MVDRTDVALNQLQVQPKAIQQGGVTYRAPQIGAPGPSRASTLLSALQDVTGQALPLLNTELQKQIQLDKVEQTTRAYRGQEVTENATLTGQAAHKVVDANQQLQAVNTGIVDWINNEYRMGNSPTPEQIDKYKTDQYNAVFELYPDVDDDKTVSRFLTLKMQEAAPAILGAELTARAGWEKAQRNKSFSVQAETWLETGTAEDLQNSLPKLQAVARGLNVSPDEAQGTLVQLAITKARTGDDRLLSVFEKMPGLAGNEKLVAARDTYEKQMQMNDAVGIGNEMSLLQAQIDAGEVDRNDVMAVMQGLQRKYGTSLISDGQAKSMLDHFAERDKKSKEEREALAYLGKQGDLSLKYDPLVPDKVKEKIPGAWDKTLVDTTNDRVKRGEITADQGRLVILSQEAQWSERNQFKFPQLDNALQGSLNVDSKSFKGGTAPIEIRQAWDTIRGMSPATRSLYLSGDQQLQFNSFDTLRRQAGMTDLQAWDRAQYMRDNPQRTPPTAQELKKINSVAASAFERTWTQALLQQGAATPNWQVASLKKEVLDMTNTLLRTGTSMPEAAAKTAAEIVAGNKTKAFNGTYINAPAAQLQQWGFGTQKEMDKGLELYVAQHRDTLRAAAADNNLTAKDVQFRAHNGMLSILDKNGTLLANPVPAASINNLYKTTERASRKAAVAAASGAPVVPSGLYAPNSMEFMRDLMPALIQQESGGKKDVVSPKGAFGETQIMPKTAKNPGYGVKPYAGAGDEKRFTQDYFFAMQDLFKGDVKLSLAAYNAGPVAVQNAIAQAKKDGKQPYFENLKLPEETRKYVPGILGRMHAGTFRRYQQKPRG